MPDIKTIIQTIEDAVKKLSDVAAASQDPLYKSLVGMLKNLDTKGDNLVNNINNLKKINEIKVKLEKLILNDKYKQELKAFAQSYTDLQAMHNQYFASFNANFKPKQTLAIIKKSAVETTLNGLTEVGLEVGVTDGIRKILQQNITIGGSYADMTEQLRNYMLTNDTGEGALEKYVKTYSTTAINQYSAEYNKAIADDLGLEWYGYDGSLLTTSRPFCIKAVEQGYIHVSEFEAILNGHFLDGSVHVSKSTGLPDGLMAGTDKGNLVRRRGGWNCGHQMIAVSAVIVPQSIKDKVYATEAYKSWKKGN